MPLFHPQYLSNSNLFVPHLELTLYNMTLQLTMTNDHRCCLVKPSPHPGISLATSTPLRPYHRRELVGEKIHQFQVLSPEIERRSSHPTLESRGRDATTKRV